MNVKGNSGNNQGLRTNESVNNKPSLNEYVDLMRVNSFCSICS